MPVSKSGKLYFTDAQYKAARECSALEYALAAGYDLLEHSATSYRLQQHDSMIFTQDGRWFWNSQNVSGRALELLQYYENLTLPEAVNILINNDTNGKLPDPEPKKSIEPSPKPFELPEKSPSFRRLFAYLCGSRKLDLEIVQSLVRQKRIYESVRQYRCASSGELRTAHNVVFVGFDEHGQPRSAFQRGTNTAVPFKRDVAGSQKQYAFCCPGRDGVFTVAVFEASIDAISHATLAKLSGMDWRDKDRIALGGVAPAALLYYLRTHPQIHHIELCLDNDAAGAKAIPALIAALQSAGYDEEHGYTITTSLPPSDGGKDWNAYLVLFRQVMDQEKGQ